MTLLHRPVAQVGAPHLECWKGACGCLESSGRAHLLKPSNDQAGTSAIRSQNQTPPGSPFHTAGASVQSSLPSPQQHDLSAINCDFLDDYTWAGMSYPSVGHYGLSNDAPTGGLEDIYRQGSLPANNVVSAAEGSLTLNAVPVSMSNAGYDSFVQFATRAPSPTLGILPDAAQKGPTSDHRPFEQHSSVPGAHHTDRHLGPVRPSAFAPPRSTLRPGSSTPFKCPPRTAAWADSLFLSPLAPNTPRLGPANRALSETRARARKLDGAAHLVGRIRPGFDGRPARPRKLRMMREALQVALVPAHTQRDVDVSRGYDDEGEEGNGEALQVALPAHLQGADDVSRGYDDEGEEGDGEEGGSEVDDVGDYDDGVGAEAGAGVGADVGLDAGKDDPEYEPEEEQEEEAESDSEYDPDEDSDDDVRPKKKQCVARGSRAGSQSLARTNSSQSVAGSETSGGGVFPPRKKGRFTEEMDRVFLQRLGELFRQKVMLKDTYRYFPGRTPRQLRRHWMRVKHKYGIGSIKNVESILAKLGPLKKDKDPLSLKQLASYFKLPMEEACQKFNEKHGQQLTFQKFRQLFQKHGVIRWPYRQVMAGKPVSEIVSAAKAAVQEMKAQEAAAQKLPDFLPEGGAELALPAPPQSGGDASVPPARRKGRRSKAAKNRSRQGGLERAAKGEDRRGPVNVGVVKNGKHAAGRRFPVGRRGLKPAAFGPEMPALEESPQSEEAKQRKRPAALGNPSNGTKKRSRVGK